MVEFEQYARTWINLVEKCGEIHHGYFMPSDELNNLANLGFSFPEIGKNGPNNIAVVTFSFLDIKSYKTQMANDLVCRKITKLFNRSKCVFSYERNFLRPIFSGKL